MALRVFQQQEVLLRLGFAQLNHDLKVFDFLLRIEQRLHALAKIGRLVNEPLGLLAVVPESFGGHQGVQFAQPLFYAGDVKETSASGQSCLRRRPTALW